MTMRWLPEKNHLYTGKDNKKHLRRSNLKYSRRRTDCQFSTRESCILRREDSEAGAAVG